MYSEDGVGFERGEQAFLQHPLRAPKLVWLGGGQAAAFFGRLEDEHDFARQVLAHARQYFGGGHQHCGVRVVAAGVHDVHFLALVVAAGLGGERQTFRLLDRQGVHVGAQGNHRAGLAAFEDADHAGVGDAGMHLEAELAQVVGHQLGGAHLLATQFRVLVDVATPFDQFGLHCGRTAVGLFFECAG
ncbi:hypothetical protein D3C73_784040 [compost metagenome]